jgi:hypothetical protein
MISRKERYFGIFEFSIRVARHTDHPIDVPISLFSAIREAVLKARADGDQIRQSIEENELYISLDDANLDEEKKVVALLFTVVDANAADAVYRKLKSGKERVVLKGPDEGGAASAHLVIDLNSPPNVFRYRCGLEDVEGVSRSRILPFLQELIRGIGGPVTAVIDDEEVQGEAKVEMQSLHKDTLSDAAGRPLAVQLVQLERRKRLDGVGQERYRESSKIVNFAIDRKGSAQRAMEGLLQIRERQKTDYPDYALMRVQWLRPDSKTQTVHVDSIAEDLLQRALTRLELMTGFTEPLTTATLRIRYDLVDKALDNLRKDLKKPS